MSTEAELRLQEAAGELLQARSAARRLTAALVANKHLLDKPFTDEPGLSPWTRGVKPALEGLRAALGMPAGPATEAGADRSKVAENYLVELLTRTQRQHLIAMDGPDEEPAKARVLRASVIVSQFSAAWFLSRLLKVDPAAAEAAVEDLRGVLEDGGSIGEFTWDMLAARGVDPASIVAVPEPQADRVICRDCGLPVVDGPNKRDTRHDHCGPLPHTGPVGGPYCEKCS